MINNPLISIAMKWERLYNFLNLFYWSIVYLQCCINSLCTAKCFSYTCMYIPFHILFHYSLSQDIEYSSLCYAVGPCCLSIPQVIVSICWPQTPKLSLPHPHFPLGSYKSVLYVCESVSVLYRWVYLCHILDSTYKWYHMIFVFFQLFHLVW